MNECVLSILLHNISVDLKYVSEVIVLSATTSYECIKHFFSNGNTSQSQPVIVSLFP